MTATLRALLHGIIDYAGLFPPAELPLERAIRSYAEHRRSAESWMLARFIVPVGRLAELDPFIEELVEEGETYRFSVLPRGGADAGEFLTAFAGDLEAIADFRARHAGRVEVDAIEARVPPKLLAEGDGAAMTAFLDDVARLADASGPPVLTPYYEAGFAEGWELTLPAFVEALGAHGRSRAETGAPGAAPEGTRSPETVAVEDVRASGAAPEGARPAGFKLRCGGVTPDAFPSPEQVAFVISHCRGHEVPMKCTAGLHHPLRHFNEGQQVTMHGFLNVFVAGILAWAEKLSPARLEQLLEDEAIGGFAFDEERLTWKGYTVPLEEVTRLRARAMTSFGSCSFDEPREDLRALGLLHAD